MIKQAIIGEKITGSRSKSKDILPPVLSWRKIAVELRLLIWSIKVIFVTQSRNDHHYPFKKTIVEIIKNGSESKGII